MSDRPPFAGFGLGLRKDYYQTILQHLPTEVDWFEIISENYLVAGGKPLYFLDQVRQHYPIAMHGVSLSIGSSAPLNYDYLQQLKALAQRIEPLWLSDHLCWTGNAHNSHDLLPLPYNEATLQHLVTRIHQVQEYLGRRIALENLSSYVSFQASEMSEWEFLNTLAKRADCYILLDINNIYVSSRNHNFVASDYLAGIDPERVIQFHLAGHSDYGDYVIDTHDAPVRDAVWQLYQQAWQRFGPVSTMIERDDKMPPFSELLAELNQARALVESRHD
ncbi:MNIO family bufferin maturase [Balneatrix alpica]|uniref:UPF0276 protein ACFFLH_02765 n=1 Tax=Balneatrix alpica TaxID=75684 RepID=A0ABV5Z7S7_9GAMM|nr:DUF692 domain-containing protein [Balneatrix alpica]